MHNALTSPVVPMTFFAEESFACKVGRFLAYVHRQLFVNVGKKEAGCRIYSGLDTSEINFASIFIGNLLSIKMPKLLLTIYRCEMPNAVDKLLLNQIFRFEEVQVADEHP